MDQPVGHFENAPAVPIEPYWVTFYGPAVLID